MSPSPCCQPKSADARFGMALSCVWACAAAPTAREAISTALHRKAVLDIASSSATKFESTVWQMPICLPGRRLSWEAAVLGGHVGAALYDPGGVKKTFSHNQDPEPTAIIPILTLRS